MSKECLQMQRLLLLEVHDLLEAGESKRLQDHLQWCPRCLEEKIRLERLLEAMRPGELLPEASSAALGAERRKALERASQNRGRAKRVINRFLPRLQPLSLAAAAGAIGLMLAAGYWSLRPSQHQPSSGQNLQQLVSEQDEKVIEHLDFFQEMDTIQKLVRITNDSNQGESSSDEGGQSHGSLEPMLRDFQA